MNDSSTDIPTGKWTNDPNIDPWKKVREMAIAFRAMPVPEAIKTDHICESQSDVLRYIASRLAIFYKTRDKEPGVVRDDATDDMHHFDVIGNAAARRPFIFDVIAPPSTTTEPSPQRENIRKMLDQSGQAAKDLERLAFTLDTLANGKEGQDLSQLVIENPQSFCEMLFDQDPKRTPLPDIINSAQPALDNAKQLFRQMVNVMNHRIKTGDIDNTIGQEQLAIHQAIVEVIPEISERIESLREVIYAKTGPDTKSK